MTPLFAVDQIAKAQAARGAPPFDAFVLDQAPAYRHRSRALREIRGPAAQERRPAARGHGRRLGVTVAAARVVARYNPQELLRDRRVDRSAEGPWVSRLGMTGFQTTYGTVSIIEIAKHSAARRTKSSRSSSRSRRCCPRSRPSERRRRCPRCSSRGSATSPDTNTQTVATLRGRDVRHRVREAGERRRRVSSRPCTSPRARARAKTPTNTSTRYQRARAVRADAAAEQLHPGESRREAGGRPPMALARRDGEVRAARTGRRSIHSAPLNRALQQEVAKVTVRVDRRVAARAAARARLRGVLPRPAAAPHRGQRRRRREDHHARLRAVAPVPQPTPSLEGDRRHVKPGPHRRRHGARRLSGGARVPGRGPTPGSG